MDHDAEMKKRIPTHLTVTMNLKWIESIKEANLDINETTLLFEYPEIYYLDLNLKYQVDKDAGNAKFDKKKKTLTIKLPIIGLTEDSQKVMDEHYQKTVVEQAERFKVLQTQGEVQEDDKTDEQTKASETPEYEYSDELREAAKKQLDSMAAYDIVEGEGTTRSLRMDAGAKDDI